MPSSPVVSPETASKSVTMLEKCTRAAEEGTSITVPLKDVLKALRVFGIGPLTPRKLESRIKQGPSQDLTTHQIRYNQLAWVIMHIWIVRLLLRLGQVFLGKGKVGEAAVELLRGLASSVSLNRIILYRRRVCHFFWSVDHVTDRSLSYGKLSSFTSVYTIGIWLYILVRLILDVANLFTTVGFKGYMEQWLLVDTIPGSLTFAVYIIAVPDTVIRRLILSGPTIFMISFYSQLMWVIVSQFNSFHCTLKRKCTGSRNFGSDRLRQLRIRHADLCLLVQDVDDIMSPLAFLWHAMMVLGACAEATHLLQLKISEDAWAIVHISLDLAYMLVFFGIVSFSSAAVCQAYNATLNYVNLMSARMSQVDDAEFARQALLLMSQMQSISVSVTAWKFYDMNRAALITTLGAVVTYVVVVFQMAPKLLQGPSE
ncbi:hypothetical protein IscW_ISCW023798 [Ixodes scapularis]|uniref:Uncharacterized protein n=1 Tax=Ixodes scapularis TaxID=6945 RepID=B7QHK0_IXOSC|nr:hypothetical protein IscW_ISCW023798 [Ixodes scapularis]|eukprot:XP_002414657.1 hypothetical protein IscW_ISCW023798 [Ixodes scapularis]